MTENGSHVTAVERFATVFEALGVSPDVLIEANNVPEPLSFAGLQSLSSAVYVDGAEGSADPWRSALETNLPNNWTAALVNGFVSAGSFATSIAGGRQQGPAGLISVALGAAAPGALVVTIAPAALFTTRSNAAFREWLWTNHQPTWLLTFRNEGSIPEIHSALEFALVVVRAGPASHEATRILRLIDFDSPEQDDWSREIRRARKREGGEAGRSIVLRDPQLGREGWTYRRFSRAFGKVIDDLRELGDIVRLGDLIAESRLGLAPQEMKRLQVEPDLFTETEGGIKCFTGRSTVGGALSGPDVWLNGDISSDLHLRAGDILLRRLVAPRARQVTNLAAVVGTGDLPAVFDNTLIRLRPKPEVSATTIEILASFMNSEHFTEILTAAGQGMVFSPAAIAELKVPMPSADVLRAFDRLAEWEHLYKEWAHACSSMRSSVLSASSYRSAVEELLAQERIDYERTTAAAASQTFEYRVQNYFPYPIALRRELLRQREHNKARIDDALACAEHAMNLLAFASILQISPEGTVDALKTDWRKAVKAWSKGVLDGLGLKPDDPEELAWRVVYTTLRQAALSLVEDNRGFLTRKPPNPDRLPDELEIALTEIEIRIAPEFLSQAWRLPLLRDLQRPFTRWLLAFGVEKKRAVYIAAQLPQRFGYCLWDEWARHRDIYQPLEQARSVATS